MRLRKGKPNYVCPDIGIFTSAHVCADKHIFYAVMHVSHEQMNSLRRNGIPLGIPNYIAFSKRVAMLFPAPDKVMTMELRYYPPMEIA